jgi:hypothetical protein
VNKYSVSNCNFRFSCTRLGDALQFRGILSADVEYARYKDLFQEVKSLDFLEVKFASWNGLLKLFNFLKDSGFKGLGGTNLSWDLLGPVCFLDARYEVLTPQSFQVSFTKNGATALENCTLEKLLELSKDPLSIEKSENGLAQGFLLLLMRRYLNVDANPQSEIMLSHEKSMLTAIAAFQKAIFDLCYNQVFAIGVSVTSVARELCARKEMLSSALAELGAKVPSSLQDLTWDSLSSRLDTCFETLLVQLEKLSGEMATVLEKLKFIWIENPSVQGDQKSLLSRLSQLKARISNFETVADEIGVSVFIQLQELSISQSVSNLVQELKEKYTSADQLTMISGAFNVLDPFASESWDSLMPEIENEINSIEAMFMGTLVESQGFDAVKQVVQKRAKELEVWEVYGGFNNFAPGQADFEQGRGLLLDELTRKLVTEQERLAYEIFFGHLKPRTAETVDTSEVSFFFDAG